MGHQDKKTAELLADMEKVLKELSIKAPKINIIPKKFLYCEATDGGMEYWTIENPVGIITEFPLLGWMSEELGCKDADTELLIWALTKAEIGDYFEHRMGVCIRVNL